MNWLGRVHLGLAIGALLLGLLVVIGPKGTRRHRKVGQGYVAAMIGLNVTALMIYRLFGHFGPFHVAAVISLLTVVAGFISARRRSRDRWVEAHAYWMSWSYVGLLAAAVSEALTRIPESPFWWMVALATAAVIGAGALVIYRRVPRILRALPGGGSG